MTREEKVAYLQAKANELIKFFDNRKLPTGPIKLFPWATITDVEAYKQTQLLRLHSNHNNPFSRVYIAAYFALQDLKNYIDGNIKTGNNASTKPPASLAGH